MNIIDVLRLRQSQFHWASASLAKPCDAKSLFRRGMVHPTGFQEQNIYGINMV